MSHWRISILARTQKAAGNRGVHRSCKKTVVSRSYLEILERNVGIYALLPDSRSRMSYMA